MSYIVNDVIPSIYLNLDIDTLYKACYIDQSSKKMCMSDNFWKQYFNYNNVKIYFDYTNFSIRDWVMNYKKTVDVYQNALRTIQYLQNEADTKLTSRILFRGINGTIIPTYGKNKNYTVQLFFYDVEESMDLTLMDNGIYESHVIDKDDVLDIITAIYFHYPDKWLNY